jgi:hypothetical protein
LSVTHARSASSSCVGQTKPGLGSNSPVIYTEQGEDDEVAYRHFNARLWAGIGIDDAIPDVPSNRRRFTWIDNGNCP